MVRIRVGWLLLALLGPTPARASDFPGFTPGASDLTFERSAPESSDTELMRRFRSVQTPPEYKVAKERFRVWIPKGYRHDQEPWGLFVWVDPGDAPNLPDAWHPVLADRRFLAVGPYQAGNDRDLPDRYRLALDAAHNLKQRFHVDPGRVYISGLSGGGRVASMLGVACGDVFRGTFPMVGTNFYKPIATGEPGKFRLPSFRPDPQILAACKPRNRYALLTGETDVNRESTHQVYESGFRAEGFRHVLYLEVPDMGHARPPAEWFAKGLDFLDRHEDNRPASSRPSG
jgi:hypothetical protein